MGLRAASTVAPHNVAHPVGPMYRRATTIAGTAVLLLGSALGVWALLRPYADLQRLYGRGFAIVGVVAGLVLMLWSRRIPPSAGFQHSDWIRSHRGALLGAAALLVAAIGAVVFIRSSDGEGPPEPAPAPTRPQ